VKSQVWCKRMSELAQFWRHPAVKRVWDRRDVIPSSQSAPRVHLLPNHIQHR